MSVGDSGRTSGPGGRPEGEVVAAVAGGLEEMLLQFCGGLRGQGLLVTPPESIDAARALAWIDATDRATFHDALKTCLVKREEDLAAFEKEFQRFWRQRGSPAPLRDTIGGVRRGTERPGGRAPTLDRPALPRREGDREEGGGGRRREVAAIISPPTKADTKQTIFAVFSPVERTQRRDFGELSTRDIPQIRRSLKRLTRRLATKRGRRVTSSRNGRPDLGRTLRAAVGSGGGEILAIEREERLLSRTRLLVLCDVSGSMGVHSERLIKILHQAANKITGSRVFVFSTRVIEITPHLRGRSVREGAAAVSEGVDIWGSGTRMGPALRALLSRGGGYLGPGTVLVVISDGWELGDLGALREAMEDLRKKVSNVVWVNPLADDPEFEPSAAGMQAVLPHVDFLAGLDVFIRPLEFERVFGKSLGPRLHRRGATSKARA